MQFTKGFLKITDAESWLKETTLIQELKPTLNDNVGSVKLYLY